MIVVIYETLKDFQFDIRGILRRNIKEFFYPFFLSFFPFALYFNTTKQYRTVY